MSHEEIENIRSRALASHYFCSKNVLSYDRLQWAPHGELSTFLDNSKKRTKLVLMPRGSFKSSHVTVGRSNWKIANNQDIRILISCETQQNAILYVNEIKSHIERNQKFRALFGDMVNKKGVWRASEFTVKGRTAGGKEATVTAGSLEKGAKTGMHYDCLHPDTKILTALGFKAAKDIKIFDRVYSLDGAFHYVDAIQVKKSTKDLIGIRPHYQAEESHFTEDHKLFCFKDGAFKWMEAGLLSKDDFLVVPKPKKGFSRIIFKDSSITSLLNIPEVWRLIGYWLAEGCHTKAKRGRNSIRLSIGSHEKEMGEDIANILQRYLKVPASFNLTKTSTCLISFSHKGFKKILSRFGTHSYNKKIPPFALNALYHLQREMIIGYYRGDGSRYNDTVSFSSSSPCLLAGIQLILTRFNIQSGLSHGRKAGRCLVAGNLCNVRDGYTLTSTSPILHLLLNEKAEMPIRPIRSFFTDKYWVVPIVKLTRQKYEGEVWDIQVRDSHSFYCQGIVAHNCIILDDVVSPKNIGSPEQIQKTIDHYKLLLSILDPDGELIVIGTRWGYYELYAWLQDPEEPESENVDVFHRAAEDNYGNLLMPNVLSREFLDSMKKTQGPWIYGCQYLNKVEDSESQTFKKETILFYDKVPTGCYRFLTIDMAIAQHKRSDYIGLVLNAVDYYGLWYIERAEQLKVEPDEVINIIFDIATSVENFMALGMEKFALEKMLKFSLMKEMEKRNVFFAIKDVETSTRISKNIRIRALQPLFQTGVIHLHRSQKDLFFQITKHPQLKHDDILDALKSQMQIVFPSDIKPEAIATDPGGGLTGLDKRAYDELQTFDKKPRKIIRKYEEIV